MTAIDGKLADLKPSATCWTPDVLAGLAEAKFDQAAIIDAAAAKPMSPSLDVWDAWPLADPHGNPVAWCGGELWFALTVERAADPEQRHHLARIHHFHRLGDQFKHIGLTLPEEISPAARQWSGSARLENGEVTLFFTATGHKGDATLSYHQRLFLTRAPMPADGEFGAWSEPVEFVQADGHFYRPANENEGEPGKIKAFRDPSHYRSREGQDYVLFTGSSGTQPSLHDGVIGAAIAEGDGYSLLPPLITASGVSNELERPHIVEHGGRIYLFWSTQRGVFAPGIVAPTGLYGAVAESIDGPWTFLNGHGLVIGNPIERPTQAYSWWVLPDLSVTSFVDYWGPEDDTLPEAETRRARFGGTFAPFVQLELDGATSRVVG
ncbi:glycoside hydrolase family 68 protein [Altererythrobacter luteolus]|uniref:Glycoside hydrolase family 68 protein n=1 Tax=Pontixanthobacter luteolus TaxID=295089 RepID=A0A6I4V1L8_9SPHN|nr:glycoside hydrolase family 68 protein [Pontixanthobacter luteolus]MXP45832.1 glycoside hydrolase family 68 protein [Pontixanthobacter luteolus]